MGQHLINGDVIDASVNLNRFHLLRKGM